MHAKQEPNPSNTQDIFQRQADLPMLDKQVNKRPNTPVKPANNMERCKITKAYESMAKATSNRLKTIGIVAIFPLTNSSHDPFLLLCDIVKRLDFPEKRTENEKIPNKESRRRHPMVFPV